MKEKSKLRGRSIYIEHDLTKEESEIQWKLRDKAKRERAEGRRVRVGYKKLIIDGKTYIWNEEEEVLKERTHGRGEEGSETAKERRNFV